MNRYLQHPTVMRTHFKTQYLLLVFSKIGPWWTIGSMSRILQPEKPQIKWLFAALFSPMTLAHLIRSGSKSSSITRWAQKMCIFHPHLAPFKTVPFRIQIIPTLLAWTAIQKTWNWDLRNTWKVYVYFEEKNVLQGQYQTTSETTKFSLCKTRSKISKLFGAPSKKVTTPE